MLCILLQNLLYLLLKLFMINIIVSILHYLMLTAKFLEDVFLKIKASWFIKYIIEFY